MSGIGVTAGAQPRTTREVVDLLQAEGRFSENEAEGIKRVWEEAKVT
jgi:hypothetical protein